MKRVSLTTPKWLSRLSIRRKVVLIVMLVATMATLAVGSVFLVYQAIDIWRQVQDGLAAQADLVAFNCTGALSFDDSQDAQEVLESLRSMQSIVGAEVVRSDGTVLATYSRGPGEPTHSGLLPVIEMGPQELVDGQLVVQRQIVLNGNRIGSVSLRSDLGRFYRLLWTSAGLFAVTITICALLAYLLTARLQNVISRPVSSLAQAAREVSEHQDFSVRVAKEAEDELGHLADSFNEMLSQIENRDRELSRYRDQLEELVEARTAELEEAQKELVRKERLATLGRLIATVAHEIRNPLGTVRNSVFSIGDSIERGDTARVERALQLADRNIRRCDLIIEELLTYSRKPVLNLRATRIDGWLTTVLDELELPEPLHWVRRFESGALARIDSDRLRRAIVNVLNNAIQSMEGEGASGTTLTVETAIEGERIEIRCIDTGAGMSEQVLERIYEPLYSTKSFGVGLGIPIVYDIMEEHSGGMSYESRPGEGTRLTLWLPLASPREGSDALT